MVVVDHFCGAGGESTGIVQAAEDWAGAVHLKSSDNEGVEVPPRPDFLAKYDGGHAPQGGCCG